MNPPPTPPRRGAGRRGQFPSWEGSGVGLLPAVHGDPLGLASVHWDHQRVRENPKRRRGGALQNLPEMRVTVANAAASWSAAALRRFRWERALGIRTVHGKRNVSLREVSVISLNLLRCLGNEKETGAGAPVSLSILFSVTLSDGIGGSRRQGLNIR